MLETAKEYTWMFSLYMPSVITIRLETRPPNRIVFLLILTPLMIWQSASVLIKSCS